MIEFANVSLCLNNRTILKDLSFKVEQGQTVLLVGSSGAGKSTILRLILGLLKATAGKIYIMGENITHMSEKELNKVRQKFSLVFQEGALFDSLSLEENVGFFLTENLKLSEEEVHRKVMEITRFLGLEHLEYHFYWECF